MSVEPAVAYRIATPLTPVGYYPKYGPLPAVVEVRRQSGDWDTPGRSRRLILGDGGEVTETILTADAPDRFRYRLDDFDGTFRRLVADGLAEWDFVAVDGGTEIRWRYRFDPLPGRLPVVALIVRLFWAPYMRRVLPGIAAEVERAAAA